MSCDEKATAPVEREAGRDETEYIYDFNCFVFPQYDGPAYNLDETRRYVEDKYGRGLAGRLSGVLDTVKVRTSIRLPPLQTPIPGDRDEFIEEVLARKEAEYDLFDLEPRAKKRAIDFMEKKTKGGFKSVDEYEKAERKMLTAFADYMNRAEEAAGRKLFNIPAPDPKRSSSVQRG